MKETGISSAEHVNCVDETQLSKLSLQMTKNTSAQAEENLEVWHTY